MAAVQCFLQILLFLLQLPLKRYGPLLQRQRAAMGSQEGQYHCQRPLQHLFQCLGQKSRAACLRSLAFLSWQRGLQRQTLLQPGQRRSTKPLLTPWQPPSHLPLSPQPCPPR